MMKRYLILFLIVSLCFSTFGFGSAAEKKKDIVVLTGEKISGDTEDEIMFITGNVKIVQGKDVITGDKARIDVDEKHLLMEGKVLFVSDDLRVTSQTLDYKLNDKKGYFEGKVILERMEKAESDSAKKTTEKKKDKDNKKEKEKNKDPFKLYTEKLFFESEDRNCQADNIRVEHKDFDGTANHIDYRDADEIMYLSGDIRIKKPKGDEIRSEKLTFDLSENIFTATEKVRVVFDAEDDEDDDEKSKGTASKGEKKEEVELQIKRSDEKE